MQKGILSALLFCLSMSLWFALPQIYAEDSASFENASSYTPLNQPNLSDTQLESWIRKIVVLPYQYDADNFEERWAVTQKYFTAEGWKRFQKTLRQTGSTDHLRKSNIVVNARITGPVKIVGRGVVNGHYFWKAAIPIYISYNGRSLTHGQKALAVLIIVRVDKSTTSDEIAIAQYSTSIQAVA